ncbi:YceI family protein [bacterium SCSIO 12741]|nr:YceI family protein [bacterium SCSIO 12741]
MGFSAPNPLSTIYKTSQAKVHFSSEAPMEIIKAESSKLVGLFNTEKNSFAFQVSCISFMGFNSELQREHFNENYMESTKYPKIKFVGKLVDPVDYNQKGKTQVKVKGSLNIHGISKERTLDATLEITDNKLIINSQFEVPLADHNIKIPTIVNQKIAKMITCTVQAEMVPKS